MLDPFDYKEPRCLTCSGEEFYNYDPDAKQGSIPVDNIIEKLDSYLYKEQYEEAHKLLMYWIEEAKELKDIRGELSMQSEVMGLSRRRGDEKSGLAAVKRGFELIKAGGLEETISAGTIWLNGATTLKAFGKADESILYYNRTLKIYDSNLKPDDKLYGGLYNNMALAYVDIGEYEKALSYYNKAIEIMLEKENGYIDAAISFVNMAELYEKSLDDNAQAIDKCMNTAYEYLSRDDIHKDGYYAFVCRKCAPSFEYYGYFKISKELNERADKIYEGA